MKHGFKRHLFNKQQAMNYKLQTTNYKLKTKNRERGFTLFELLTVIVILAVLVALTIPAVSGARRMTQRISCLNHLRRIGAAFDAYAFSLGGYPPVRTVEEFPARSARNKNDRRKTYPAEHGWTYDLLPYMELQAIHDAFDTSMPYYEGLQNQRMMMKRLDDFQCPATPDKNRLAVMRYPSKQVVPSVLVSPPGEAKGCVTDYYVHHGGVLKPDGKIAANPLAYKNERTPGKNITDGLSMTILVDEMAGRPTHWRNGKRDDRTLNDYGTAEVETPECSVWGGIPSTKLRAWSADGRQAAVYENGPMNFDRVLNATNNGVYSFHVRGANILVMDGSARFVYEDVAAEAYLSLSTKDGGEPFRPADMR